MKINILNTAGDQQGSVDISDQVFGASENDHVLHKVVKAYRANRRQGTHATKTRSMVSGGGKKPFRQKGTGNARQGSSRSPLMEGGAVSHGPQPRSYKQKINKALKRKALAVALSEKLRFDNLVVVDDLELASYSTKAAVSLVKTLGVSGKKVLFVVDSPSDFFRKSFNNLRNVNVLSTSVVNTENVLASEVVVMNQGSIASVEKRLVSEKG